MLAATEASTSLAVDWVPLAISIFVAVLGSSVLATVIERSMSRGDSRRERGRGRADALLDALGEFRGLVQRHESKIRGGGAVVDEKRDLAFAKAFNRVLIAATSTGDDVLARRCKAYRHVAERFASGDPDTTQADEETSFEGVLTGLSRYLGRQN